MGMWFSLRSVGIFFIEHPYYSLDHLSGFIGKFKSVESGFGLGSSGKLENFKKLKFKKKFGK